MTIKSKVRDLKWDFVKGLLIIFVIWGHCCSYISGDSYEKNFLTTYIRLFQMPLFIFISGFFQTKVHSLPELIKKMKKLIIHIGVPFGVWMLISYLAKQINIIAVGGTINFDIVDVIRASSALWYLGCLGICASLFLVISYVFKRSSQYVLGLSIVLLMLIPTSIFQVQFMWPFYLLGHLAHNSLEMCKNLQKDKKKSDVIVLILSLIVGFSGYMFPTKYTFYNIGNYFIMDAFLESVIFILLRFALYWMTSMVVLYWMIRLYNCVKDRNVTKVICSIGQKTLFLYVSHVTILLYTLKPIIQTITDGKGVLPNNDFARYYILATLLTCIVMIILLILEKYLTKNRITSLIFCGK